jgi:replication factor A1
MANKKFTSIKNDFCLTLGRETEIQECGEDVSILNNGFSFTSIELLKQTPGTATVDVIGVVFEIGPVGSIKMKSGESKDKLNVTIADDTKHSVPVTIWGNIANKLVS